MIGLLDFALNELMKAVGCKTVFSYHRLQEEGESSLCQVFCVLEYQV